MFPWPKSDSGATMLTQHLVTQVSQFSFACPLISQAEVTWWQQRSRIKSKENLSLPYFVDRRCNRCTRRRAQVRTSWDSRRVSTHPRRGLEDATSGKFLELSGTYRENPEEELAAQDLEDLEEDGWQKETAVPDREGTGSEEACDCLEKRLGCDQAAMSHLRDNYPPLRGEAWYRRGEVGTKDASKRVLQDFRLDETLPGLVDILLGAEAEGGAGMSPNQVQQMFVQVPYLIGEEAAEASSVVSYLRTELGLVQRGELGSALVNCPAMLLYNVPENLDRKVCFYLDSLDWTKEDVRFMLSQYPNLLSIKLEGGRIEVLDILRLELGLREPMVGDMVREFPPLLEVRPKRLRALVKYLWKVLEIPLNGVAVMLSRNPRICTLEAEANLAPLRFFFERELYIKDTARIGQLVYKFPDLLLRDVESTLLPRAEEFRRALGLEGMEPLPPRSRSRPKRNGRPAMRQGNASAAGSEFRGRGPDRRRNLNAGPVGRSSGEAYYGRGGGSSYFGNGDSPDDSVGDDGIERKDERGDQGSAWEWDRWQR